MDERLKNIQNTLQDALDELSSTRSSAESKHRALHRIERCLANACISEDSSENLHLFNALQYTFECNVPLRLLGWISVSTSTLEAMTNKGSMDDESALQATQLATQLSLSLSLIQGVALAHTASKIYLGRKYALEESNVLIDLLLASRHLPPPPNTPNTPNKGSSRSAAGTPISLTSVLLDTFLCVLVDSPGALRVFEDANGVQAVVKILKRAGTPREVRMKCLEFLYFYLLDEAPVVSDALSPAWKQVQTPPPTVPATPIKPSKPFISSRPMRPSSHLGSSDFSFPSSSTNALTPSGTPRSTSGSSTNSFSSTSSVMSGSTAPSSLSSSPEKPSSMSQRTEPSTPPLAYKEPQLQPRSLMMLRKELDYEPQSPKKAPLPRTEASISRHTPGKKSISRSRLAIGSEDDCHRYDKVSATSVDRNEIGRVRDNDSSVSQSCKTQTRTTEEKKELLGTMLGNVDALVEGVKKAGIWGLG